MCSSTSLHPFRCIRKCRNISNTPVLYILRNLVDNRLVAFTSDVLRSFIKCNRINVTNLKLSKSDRIIDCNEGVQDDESIALLTKRFIRDHDGPKHLKFMSNANLTPLIKKAEMVGCQVYYWDNLVAISSQHDVLIASAARLVFINDFYDTDNNGITRNTSSIFALSHFKSIDLDGVDFSYMTCMNHMFFDCEAEEISLRNASTSNVKSLKYTFGRVKAKKINFGQLDFRNVDNMYRCFEEIKLEQLDLSTWKVKFIDNTKEMFMFSKIGKLTLGNNWYVSTNLVRMFANFKTPNVLDLNGLSVGDYSSLCEMFYDTKAKAITLRQIDPSRGLDCYNMFDECKAPVYGTYNLKNLCNTWAGNGYSETPGI